MSATTPFQPTGPTIRVTAAVSGSLPFPVQATTGDNVRSEQYVVTNEGSVVAWLAWGQTADQATANCVQPVTGAGGGKNVYTLLNGSQITLTLPPQAFFCAISASSTAIIDITPGYGQ